MVVARIIPSAFAGGMLGRRFLAAALPIALWAAGANIPLLRQGALFLAPFFLLLALWTAGVDAEPILRRIRKAERPRARRTLRPSLSRAPRVIAQRGGLLLASSLAGRAPPPALSAAV